MREFKFKGWDKKNKIWYKPEELIQLPNLIVGYFDESGFPKTEENIILSQYIGLKDKNKIEIYEGDLIIGYFYRNGIKIEWTRENPAVVRWVANSAGFFPFILNNENQNILKNIEVIGNIFENPELKK